MRSWSSILIICSTFFITACISAGTKSSVDSWAQAMSQQDFRTAERLFAPSNFTFWENEMTNLRFQHGLVKSYGRSDIAEPGNSAIVTRLQWTWEDGTTRCLRIQTTNNQQIKPLDNNLQPCPSSFLQSR